MISTRIFEEKISDALQKALALKNQFVEIEGKDGLLKCSELLAETLESKVVALPKDISSLIEGFKEWFGSDYLVVGVFLQGEVIGFIGYIKTPTALRAMHYGATSNAPDELYSALMFEVIERGIQLEVLEINLGRTATEIKSTYGAVPHDNYFSFYTRNPIMKFVLSLVQWRYNPKEYILRAPFKEKKNSQISLKN